MPISVTAKRAVRGERPRPSPASQATKGRTGGESQRMAACSRSLPRAQVEVRVKQTTPTARGNQAPSRNLRQHEVMRRPSTTRREPMRHTMGGTGAAVPWCQHQRVATKEVRRQSMAMVMVTDMP